jgi:hypothetical protein
LDTSRGAQMPEWMWIIISVAGGAGVIVLLWAVVTRGITASHGRTSIVIAGKMQDPDDPINKALQYVQRSTPEIQHIMFRRYLRLLKEAGADPDYLSDYDDARFVRVLLRYLVNGGNGSRSIQKIVEEEMISGEWKRSSDDLREYVAVEVWPPIVRAIKDLVNQEYDTDVLEFDGTRRKRLVSNTDFIDGIIVPEVRDAVISEIVAMFAYGRKCLSNGCE